ncbi:F-box protein [Rhizoctonia solani AG-3 Rhs1AP]|uniref:F-box protein n=1 Tax=Rhizoctonia solani AG-3 Rhs1AP TaxID=1086054 RepID=X8JPN2_9AGAM|nr:F-box protein [Rhizoctonia solani AG-3 Rhs1AP]
MSRRITRSQRATRTVPVQQNEIVPSEEAASSSTGGGEAQVASAPPRKQARTTKNTRPKKNKENTLSGLLMLPIELFTEIMHNLKPIDILNLSRTCKTFRGLLMRRSSEPIWKSAAGNLSYRLPPPPPWLDMPQYVSVVYTNNCSACGGKAVPKENKQDPEFQPVLLVRLCAACQPNVLSYVFSTCLVNIFEGSGINILEGPGINMHHGQYGLRTELQKIKKEYKANKIKFADNKKDFRAWKLAKTQAITRYSKRDHWGLIENVEQDRVRQNDDVKYQFRRDVEKRLTEMGWEHDIYYTGGKEWRLLVTQPRRLTDRIWKNRYPKLLPFLEKARSTRLAKLPLLQQKYLNSLWDDKHCDLGTRVIVHPQHAEIASNPVYLRLAPSASEAMNWPLVKQVLEPCPSYEIIKNCVAESWEIIRPLAQTWQHDVESQLAGRLKDDTPFTRTSGPRSNAIIISGQAVSVDLDVLLRADSVFRFTDNTARFFPNDFMDIWDPNGLWLLHYPSVTSSPIVEGAQSFTVAREQAKALLQCLGHPNASHLSMSAYGKRFVCGPCVHLGDTHTEVYDWKGLVSHYTSIQVGEPEPEGTVPDPVKVEIAIAMRVVHCLETLARLGHQLVHILSVDDARKYAQGTTMLFIERPWLSYSKKHACLHCTDCKGLDLPLVLAHVQHTHYIMEPEAHRDYENYEVYIRQSLGATYEYQT